MPNTRLTMMASSICLAAAGFACLFAPEEALRLLGMPGAGQVLAQIVGALYLGNAAGNWTARGSMIGGIYARPLSVANFMHFVVGSAVLIKGIAPNTLNVPYIVLTLAYLVFAVLFVFMLWGRPGESARHDAGQR